MRACERASERACVRACERASVRACVRACMRVCRAHINFYMEFWNNIIYSLKFHGNYHCELGGYNYASHQNVIMLHSFPLINKNNNSVVYPGYVLLLLI